MWQVVGNPRGLQGEKEPSCGQTLTPQDLTQDHRKIIALICCGLQDVSAQTVLLDQSAFYFSTFTWLRFLFWLLYSYLPVPTT